MSTTTRRRERHRSLPLMPEVRHFTATNLEVRQLGHTNEITISGSPIVYNTPYVVHDYAGEFRETIHRGAVSDLIANGVDCRFQFDHSGLPLARTVAGTMDLIDSSTSLNFRARLDARQQLANDVAIAVERGDISQMSVGMIVGRDQWGVSGDVETRDIYKLNDLLDVSAVTYACSPTTSIEIAQRMAARVPVESRARLRRVYAELRAGRRISATDAEGLRVLLEPALVGDEEPRGSRSTRQAARPQAPKPPKMDMRKVLMAGDSKAQVEAFRAEKARTERKARQGRKAADAVARIDAALARSRALR